MLFRIVLIFFSALFSCVSYSQFNNSEILPGLLRVETISGNHLAEIGIGDMGVGGYLDLYEFASTTKTKGITIRANENSGGYQVFYDNSGDEGLKLYGNAPGGSTHGQINFYGNSLGVISDGPFRPFLYFENESYSAETWEIGIYDVQNSFGNTHDDTYLAFHYKDNLVAEVDEFGNWYQISDERLKKNISSLSTVLPSLMKLSPKTYEMLNDDEKQIGFLAQNMFEEFPELVEHCKNDETEQYMVNYNGMIPVLTKAIQEQQKQMEKFNEIIIAQQKMIETLQSKIEDPKE